mmetsp:Transcript_101498/g.293702  ORF Transcript_101498/g.293702 Transcript_101498/m.293702 type:complete len:248 (-) Transcript_101498:34-777(-)
MRGDDRRRRRGGGDGEQALCGALFLDQFPQFIHDVPAQRLRRGGQHGLVSHEALASGHDHDVAQDAASPQRPQAAEHVLGVQRRIRQAPCGGQFRKLLAGGWILPWQRSVHEPHHRFEGPLGAGEALDAQFLWPGRRVAEAELCGVLGACLASACLCQVTAKCPAHGSEDCLVRHLSSRLAVGTCCQQHVAEPAPRSQLPQARQQRLRLRLGSLGPGLHHGACHRRRHGVETAPKEPGRRPPATLAG